MLREVAEYPNSFGPLGPNSERIETARYTLCLGPGSTWNTVQRQRFPLDEVDEVLEEVRAHLRERGRTQTQWEVGSSAPTGLVDALLERGLRHDKDPYAVALVLTREPPPMRPGFTARRVETLEELEAACEVQWEAFGASPEEIAEARSLLPSCSPRAPRSGTRSGSTTSSSARARRRRPSTGCCSTAARRRNAPAAEAPTER